MTGREPPRRKGNKQPAAGRTETDEHRRPVSPMCCNSSFGGQTLGEDGMAAWKQPEAAGVWHRLQPGVYPDRARTCVRSATLNRHVKGGAHHSSPTLGTLTAGTAPPLRALGARKCGLPTRGHGADVRALSPQLCHLWAYSATAAPQVL